jgi:NADP-dependent 3-hydroxy acid dehydrogenase YdfG
VTEHSDHPGRVAVVTGAGSGIGRQVAQALDAAGFRLVLAGRRREALKETADTLAGDALLAPTDIRDAGAVDALFAAAVAAHGRVDVLFNNAGLMGTPASFGDIDPADWAEVVDTNLTGSFLCARAAFRVMRDQDPRGGRIINNGSISAHTPRPGSAPYTASKHAITGLTKAIALDGRPYDIACGQIDIGNASSRMTEVMERGIPQADGSVRPEPVMDAAEVGRAVVHMASLPLGANVLSMTIMASAMPFVGRG